MFALGATNLRAMMQLKYWKQKPRRPLTRVSGSRPRRLRGVAREVLPLASGIEPAHHDVKSAFSPVGGTKRAVPPPCRQRRKDRGCGRPQISDSPLVGTLAARCGVATSRRRSQILVEPAEADGHCVAQIRHMTSSESTSCTKSGQHGSVTQISA